MTLSSAIEEPPSPPHKNSVFIFQNDCVKKVEGMVKLHTDGSIDVEELDLQGANAGSTSDDYLDKEGNGVYSQQYGNRVQNHKFEKQVC